MLKFREICSNCNSNTETVCFCVQCGFDFIDNLIDSNLVESLNKGLELVQESKSVLRKVVLRSLSEKQRDGREWKYHTFLMKINNISREDVYRHAAEDVIAFDSGYVLAQEKLFNGDNGAAMAIFKPLAESGEIRAMTGYGECLLESGNSEALEWLMKAANLQYGPAMARIGYCYLDGEFAKQHTQKAIEWFLKAAGEGSVSAELELGLIYGDGKGVETDNQKAVKWFERAAFHGNELAQYRLALMYETGCGVSKNLERANYWCKAAAQRHYEEAIEKLDKLENNQ